jgi:hypothetical protein
LDENGNMVASAIVPSEIDPEITSIQALEKACAHASGLGSYKNLAYLVGTGYGHNEVAFANENISEIRCHAMGTFSCAPAIKTLVDIGGQEVIRMIEMQKKQTTIICTDGTSIKCSINVLPGQKLFDIIKSTNEAFVLINNVEINYPRSRCNLSSYLPNSQ